MSESKSYLSTSWSFTQLTPTKIPQFALQDGEKEVIKQEEKEWYDIEKVPTSVHVELIKRGIIADPYKGLNEWDVQVSRGRFMYRCCGDASWLRIGCVGVDSG